MISLKTIAAVAVFGLICTAAAHLVFGYTSPIGSGKAEHDEQPEEQDDCVMLHPYPLHPLNSLCWGQEGAIAD